jgi:transposase
MVCHEKHRSLNADVNGAANILKVAVETPPVRSTYVEVSSSGLVAQPLLLRWNYNEW